MSDKNKRLLIVGVVVLLLCALSTTAFLTSERVSDNVLTFGNLRVQLINNTIDETGAEVPVEQSEEKLTGTSVSRIIKVKNICKNSMYVRVKIEFKGEDKQGEFAANEYVSFQHSGKGWSQGADWFYYTKELKPEQQTTDLFRELQVDLDRLMTDHAGSKLTFKVSAQAVQSDNNGASAEEAQGWPKEAGK